MFPTVNGSRKKSASGSVDERAEPRLNM